MAGMVYRAFFSGLVVGSQGGRGQALLRWISGHGPVFVLKKYVGITQGKKTFVIVSRQNLWFCCFASRPSGNPSLTQV